MGIDEFIFSKIRNKIVTIEQLQENINLFNSLVADIIVENNIEYLLEQRVRVNTIDGIQIFINANDHNPPHFHIKKNEYNAVFSIETGKKTHGFLPGNIERKIEYWYRNEGHMHLAKIWNESRKRNGIGTN